MAALRKMPSQAVPFVDPKTGLISPDWYLYFRSRESLGLINLSDVAITSPSNGEALTYSGTSAKWENT